MPMNYRYIQQYEKELLKLKEQGLTVREIGENFGLTYEQTHQFFSRTQIHPCEQGCKIKSLEMENKLMQNFLSLTERK